MKTLLDVVNDPKFKGLAPIYHHLMSEIATVLIEQRLGEIQEAQEELIRLHIAQLIGDPLEQRATIKRMMIEALHSRKAGKLMRAYAREAIEHAKSQEQLTEELAEPAIAKPAYHSSPEIRKLITDNIKAIREYFGEREVTFATICDHLQQYTTLKEGDRQTQQAGTRWSQQVSNALNSRYWKECPIVSSGVRGRYVIKPAE
jgi:hypothetical protein